MIIDHIGIACSDATKMLETFGDTLKGKMNDSLVYKDMGLSSTLIDFQSTKLEVMEPISNKNILNQFIDKRGDGLHHISFRVDNLMELYEDLSQSGDTFLHEIKTIDKGKTIQRYTFFNLSFSNGILIELFDEIPKGEGGPYE